MSATATAPRIRARIKFKPPNTWGLWYWCWRLNVLAQATRFALLALTQPLGFMMLIPIALDIWLYRIISRAERMRERLDEILGIASAPPGRQAWIPLGFVTLISVWLWSPLYI